MHQVWLWGNGGYYALLVGPDGTVGIPAGREAYLRVARYAPDDVIDKAVAALEAMRERKREEAMRQGGRPRPALDTRSAR